MAKSLQYERFDLTLRRLVMAIPLHLQASKLNELEALFERWATILETLSSQMTWIWRKHGLLAYVPGNGSLTLY